MRIVFTLLFLFCMLFNFSYASSGVSALKHQISAIEYDIKQNQRKINTISSSKNLSENEKKRKIRSLQNENVYLKRKLSKIKTEVRRII